MVLAKTPTCAVVGLEGRIIEVEMDTAWGLFAFARRRLGRQRGVGGARVRTAVRNSGYESGCPAEARSQLLEVGETLESPDANYYNALGATTIWRASSEPWRLSPKMRS